MDTGQLSQVLADRVDGEVRFDPGTRGAYAHDGSNYRQVADRRGGAAHRGRGRGGHRACAASSAPRCCPAAAGPAWPASAATRPWSSTGPSTAIGLVSVDPGGQDRDRPAGRRAGQGQRRAGATYGLMVGPKPSTHVSCTIGGMIGNNSCGSTAQAYGKMADSVRRLEILTYDGLRTWTGQTSDDEYEQIVAAGGRKAEHLPAAARDPRHLPGPDPHRLPGDPAPRLRLQPGLPAAGEAVPRG